jgi:hypothetical protein
MRACRPLDWHVRRTIVTTPTAPRGVIAYVLHGLVATHPFRRLRRAARVIVASARDPHVPELLGSEVAASAEQAIARAGDPRGPRDDRRRQAAGDAVECGRRRRAQAFVPIAQ